MQTLNKHFNSIVGPVFAKHGFAQAELLSHWPAIVGADVAGMCKPEKIRWPRGENARGGTLHLRVAAGFSLDVQQSIPLILERISGFLGHGAVQAIKIAVDHQLPSAKPVRHMPIEPPAAVAAQIGTVSDPLLQAALLRLGRAVHGEQSQAMQANPVSPQAQHASGTRK